MNREELRGGRDEAQDNEAVLKEVAKNLVAKAGAVKLKFPTPVKREDGWMESRDLSTYVDKLSDEAFKWILSAKSFLRDLYNDLAEIGEEVLLDQYRYADPSEGVVTKGDYGEYCESTLETLTRFTSANDEELRKQSEFPGRREFVEQLCSRVRQASRLAELVDELGHAESKDALEKLMAEAKDGIGDDGKMVFVSQDNNPPIRVFGKGYDLTESAFGRYRGFAMAQLKQAVVSRSAELAKGEEQEVCSPLDSDVPAETLLFGKPKDVNEKTCLLSWTHLGHKNGIRLQRSGNRLYILSALGKAQEALKAMSEEFGDNPFLPADCLVDGEHLCRGERLEEGRVRFNFRTFLKGSALFMAFWLRIGAGECLPHRLHPEDEARKPAPAANGGKKVLADNDGTKPIGAEEFFFRKGTGTISVTLPAEFILYFGEVKDENQEVLAPEREFPLTQEATLKIRRAIVGGERRIILDECDSEELKKQLRLNGVPGVAWKDTGQKGWKGLPHPLPSILSFCYKDACLKGELRPDAKK